MRFCISTPSFLGELLQILMIGVDELAAELAEHALVEIVLGEHAATPTIARLEQNRRRTGGVQAIGRGQTGDAAADDGNGVRHGFLVPLLLLGIGAPIANWRQRRSTCRGRR